MPKHSPGPWEWWTVGIDDEVMLIPKGREKIHDAAVLTLGWVSCGDGSPGREPSQEDKNLIAAAPDLLEALKECHRVIGVRVGEHRKRGVEFDAVKKAWDAIKKATGGAS